MAAIGTKIAEALGAATAFVYGCLYLTVAFVYSVQQKEYWSSPSDDEKVRLAQGKLFDTVAWRC